MYEMSEVVNGSYEAGEPVLFRPFTADSFAAERRDMVAAADAYINQNQTPDGSIGKLTALQSETLLRLRQFVVGGGTHGILQLPCGYGKSALATTAADAFGMGQLRPDGSRRQALMNTSRNSIVSQLVDRNIQYGNTEDEELLSDFAYFAPRLQPSMYNKLGKNAMGDVVVMPYQSLGNVIRRGNIHPGQFSLFLLDESHNMGQKRAKNMQDFAHHGLFIGLSATPERSRNFLPTVIDKISMADGITKYGFLSDTRLFGIPTGCDFHPEAYAAGEYRPQDVEHLAQSETRNRLIVETAWRNIREHGPGLIKCHAQLPSGFNHLAEVTRLANENAPFITRNGTFRRLRVEAVSSAIKGSPALIDEFINGDTIDALAFVDLIGEGFNMPHSQWGIWAPPTRSYRALEQFIGRGIRRDPNKPEKVFHFSQLVDTDTRNGNNALGWELFDLPRDTSQAKVDADGVFYQKGGGSGFDGVDAINQELIRYEARYDYDQLAALSLDISMRELDPNKKVVALDTLETTIGIERSWLKRILYGEDFPAYMRLVNNEPTVMYEEAAAAFAAKAIAKPEDLSVIQAAQRLGMSTENCREWLERFETPITMLYPRKWVAARRQMHLQPDAFAQLKESLTQIAQPMQPHEIGLRQVTKSLKMAVGAAGADKFLMRGFTLDYRKTRVGVRALSVGLREELMPWVHAYKNAIPAPTSGYTPLVAIVKCRFPEGKAVPSDVFVALYNLGVKPTIFIRGGRERMDFFPTTAKHAVMIEVAKTIKQRLAAEADPNIEPPKIGGCVYGSVPEDSLAQLEGTVILPAPQQAQETPKISAEAQHAAKPRVEAKEPTSDSYTNVEFSLNVQRAVIARHSAFRGLDPKTPNYAKRVRDMLTNILGRFASPIPQIPNNWLNLADLSTELNVPESMLIRLMIDKKVNDQHARYIDLNGIQGILAFCSPQFADILRKNKR